MKAFQLHFNSPLHIGKGIANYEESNSKLHSDTLYAAIIQMWSSMGRLDWIDEFKNSKETFSISSAFPFAKIENNLEYFFPRPLLMHSIFKGDLLNYTAKDLKKVSFVNSNAFFELIGGNQLIEKNVQIHGSYLIQSNQTVHWNGNVYDSEIQQRVAIPQDRDKDPKPFSVERIRFSQGAGLYFLFHGSPEWENRVESALQLLGEEGVGTDRNVGNGKFELSKKDSFEVPTLNESEFSINLGLFKPSSESELKQSIQHENARFSLINRGGWISEPHIGLRKSFGYFFQEGSLLNLKNNGSPSEFGSTYDLKPEGLGIQHSILRVGKTIFFPVKV